VLFTVSFNGLFRWIIVLIWLQPVCFPVASHGFPLSWLYILRQRLFFFVFSPPFLASDPLSNKYNTRQGTALFRGFSNLCPRGALANRHSKLKTDCLTRRMMNEFVWYSHWYPVSSRWQVVLTKQILEDNDFHTLIGSNTRLLSLGKYSHCRPVSRRSATPGG
jgi:hypothetical protein